MADITAKKGDTIPLEIVMRRTTPNPDNPAAAPTVTPVNLTGSVEIWFTAKRRTTDLDADAVIRLGNAPTGLQGVAVLDAATGRARATVPAAATAALEAGTVFLYYDVQLQELDGTITTVQSGRLALVDQVTISS